jgi:hypothetical protein
LVAYVLGTQHSVSAESASAAVLARFPELEGHFTVHRFWPAEFLFVFDSRARKDTMAGASPMDGRSFVLRFSPWNRQLQATQRTFRYHAHMEVVGIPPIAWNLDTVHSLLGPPAWVKRLGVETATRSDLGHFKVTAWTGRMTRICLRHQMLSFQRKVAFLEFTATVHLVRLEDTNPSLD